VQDTPWSRELKKEPLVEVYNPNIHHYMTCTEDDVIEILSNEVPIIEELAPAHAAEPLPGKSHVYHIPDDREQLDALIREIQTNTQQ
jgi:hypothetical protein